MDGNRRRLNALLVAGLVDSFGLAVGWTVFNLVVVERQGLAAAGLYNAAMFAGVALSAPVTDRLAERLDGRALLRSTAAIEGVLRVGSFLLLILGAPTALVAVAVACSSLTAWAGFAGMRAEVAAVDPSPRSLTRYVGSIAAVETAGAAVAALLPGGTSGGWVRDGVVVLYAACLIPTLLVAADAQVGRAARGSRLAFARRNLRPILGSFLVMAAASGPTLLFVALTAELYGPAWVAAGAAAFTVGALAAPSAVEWLAARALRPAVLWPALGAGMVAVWGIASWGVAALVLAQACSGFFFSAFEGITDSRAAGGESVTSGLGWTASARALGSAVAVGAAPGLVAVSSLGALSAVAAVLLGLAAIGAAGAAALERRPAPDPA